MRVTAFDVVTLAGLAFGFGVIVGADLGLGLSLLVDACDVVLLDVFGVCR